MAQRTKIGPKCQYCGESCHAFGFKEEMIGGCKKARESFAIREAKRLLCSTPEDQSTPRN